MEKQVKVNVKLTFVTQVSVERNSEEIDDAITDVLAKAIEQIEDDSFPIAPTCCRTWQQYVDEKPINEGALTIDGIPQKI